MKLLLDMDNDKFLKLMALQELPGELLGTEHDMTFNSVFSSEDIWNRIHDADLLNENARAKIEDYGKDSFLSDVVNHLNKNFDANDGITWDSIDNAVSSIYYEYRDKFAEMDKEMGKQAFSILDCSKLHQALLSHRRNLNGKASFGEWSVYTNSKRELHNDFLIYYHGNPVVSSVVSDVPSPSEYYFLDLRRVSELSDQAFSQICDIVKSVYSVARIAPDEQEKMEENNSVQDKKPLDLSIDGLHKALERFDSVLEDSRTATGICGPWEVSRYGYEVAVPVFNIYHDGLPVVSSKMSSELSSSGSKYVDLKRKANISDKTFSQICDVVKSVYMFARPSLDEQKRMNENMHALGK